LVKCAVLWVAGGFSRRTAHPTQVGFMIHSSRTTLILTLFVFAASACSSEEGNPSDGETASESGEPDDTTSDANGMGDSSDGEGGSASTGDGDGGTATSGSSGGGTSTPVDDPTLDGDIKDVILVKRSTDCSDYEGTFEAEVTDIKESIPYTERVVITAGEQTCRLVSNSIPNHDFNDESARFATPVSEVDQDMEIPRHPTLAASATDLTQRSYDAIMLNGVVLDILSAGCYRPDDPMADANGNVPIGCQATEPWLLDPLGEQGGFGTDMHNAHTQPNGLYHYHGNPMALFDDSPSVDGSPVIGFAADGFPIYGSYFKDPASGEVRKALSGYSLRAGARPSGDGEPGGTYDGTYNDDYEFTGAGDLDECNGMTVGGQYGYYVTDAYPWVIRCLSGTPHNSFGKGGPG